MNEICYQSLNSEITNKQDGFYDLEKDKQALKLYLECIEEHSVKHKSYWEYLNLLKDHYHFKFLDRYWNQGAHTIIKETYRIICEENFQFQSFMQAFKFYTDYALKDKNGLFLEDYNLRTLRVALFFALHNQKTLSSDALSFARLLIRQEFQPATPTFLNAGSSKGGKLVSCFLLNTEDSLDSIMYALGSSGHLSKIGGGVAVNLSNLRSKGEQVGLNPGVGKGIIPVMKLFEDMFNYVDQMGQRRGAGAVYLNIFHADILDFLDTKKINSDEKSRIQTLSLGVLIPDVFITLAKDDMDIFLFKPREIYTYYQKDFDSIDFSKEYATLVNDPRLTKITIPSRELLLKIAKIQFESGYPYLVFIDNANKTNPLRKVGKVCMSNLCTEIFQTQIKPNNDRGSDISCILGSLNLVNLMKNESIYLRLAIHQAIKILTITSQETKIKEVPSINKGNKNFRSIGLGIMNLQGYFVQNNILYSSPEAIDFCNVFFAYLNYETLWASVNTISLSSPKLEPFEGFKDSTYYTGEYFDMYLNEDFLPTTEKIKSIFKEHDLPTKENWKILKEAVRETGLYHAYRLAIAPTQSISYLQNSTPSVMPIIDHIETRVYANSTTYYPAPYLNKDNINTYELAHNIPTESYLHLIATIQKHIDQGISTTLYLDSQASTRELMKNYVLAHKLGLKSLYYLRLKESNVQVCEVCHV